MCICLSLASQQLDSHFNRSLQGQCLQHITLEPRDWCLPSLVVLCVSLFLELDFRGKEVSLVFANAEAFSKTSSGFRVQEPLVQENHEGIVLGGP